MPWMVRRIVAWGLALLALGLLAGPGRTAPAAPAAADAEPVELRQAEAAPLDAAGRPTAAWRAVALPHDWERGFAGHSGQLAYRLRFDQAPGAPALPAAYIQRACTNLEVYLNGELLASGGRMQEPVTRNCYYPQLVVLPRALLRERGNELRVHLAGYAAQEVAARQRAAGLSEIVVGPLAALQPRYDRQLFWNVTMAQIIAATIGLLGLGLLGLAALRWQDRTLFWFGLFALGWAAISARLFVQHVPLSHRASEILVCSAFAPVLACAYQFLLRMVDRRARWVDALLLAQALLVPLALLAAPADRLLTAASAVYNLVAVEFLLVVAYFFRTAWRGYRREFWLLSGVLAAAVLLAAVEIALQNDWLPLPKVHVVHFAMPLLFIVIGIRLIQLFVQALTRAEDANRELGQRVTEKSAEIERSYAQLGKLRAAQAAQQERQRIASDLHDDLGAQLLTIAQASQHGGDRERVARLARGALDEMRLSVRGLTAAPALAADVLADWRAETVARLSAAGFAVHWDAAEAPPGLVLPARVHVQLTRVLREAVSNAIRHSGGAQCRIAIALDPGGLALAVEDDGRGLPAAWPGGDRGHGLPNIERRVRVLGGHHAFERSPLGGLCLRVEVPLEPDSRPAPLEGPAATR